MQHQILQIGAVTQRMTEQMQQHYQIHVLNDVDDVPAFLASHGKDIQAIATNGHDGVPDQILQALPNLEVVSAYGVGYDGVNVPALVQRKIVLTHTPEVLNRDVANTAIMMMLATSRQLLRDDAWARSGDWAKNGAAPMTRSIEGATVGMLGMGRIGQCIAEKLQAAFNCEILYHTRTARPELAFQHVSSLVEMAQQSDYVVVITPGGAATQHLVNREVMQALGPEGTLINVARGSVVDETALVAALQNGELGAAGLDVFEQEPKIPQALCDMPNVVLLPHVGSATVETRQAMGDLVTDNLSLYVTEGQVISPVPECQVFLQQDGKTWRRS